MASVVASYGGLTSFSTTPTISITAPASGNAVVVVLTTTATPTISGVSDGAAYTQDFASAADSRRRYSYSRLNVTDSPTTITLTLSSAENVRYVVFEVSGLDSYDAGANGDTGGFTSAPSAAATAAEANSFAVGIFRTTLNRTYTAPAGWTRRLVQADPSQMGVFYIEDAGAAGTVTCAPTLDTGTNVYDSIVIYSPAAASGVPLAVFLNANQIIG